MVEDQRFRRLRQDSGAMAAEEEKKNNSVAGEEATAASRSLEEQRPEGGAAAAGEVGFDYRRKMFDLAVWVYKIDIIIIKIQKGLGGLGLW